MKQTISDSAKKLVKKHTKFSSIIIAYANGLNVSLTVLSALERALARSLYVAAGNETAEYCVIMTYLNILNETIGLYK